MLYLKHKRSLNLNKVFQTVSTPYHQVVMLTMRLGFSSYSKRLGILYFEFKKTLKHALPLAINA